MRVGAGGVLVIAAAGHVTKWVLMVCGAVTLIADVLVALSIAAGAPETIWESVVQISALGFWVVYGLCLRVAYGRLEHAAERTRKLAEAISAGRTFCDHSPGGAWPVCALGAGHLGRHESADFWWIDGDPLPSPKSPFER